MGSTTIHFLPLSSSPIKYLTINPKIPLSNPNFYPQFRFNSSSRPTRTTTSDAFRSDRFEFDDDFTAKKRRNWWSDDEDSDDDEEEDDDEFGFWDEPNPFDWLFKVLSIFGWMVPAVIISTMLGTGTNSLLMAVVLPLGQTALSLVMDKLSGSPSSSSNSSSRYKSKRRPGPRSRNRSDATNPFVGTNYGFKRNAETREARNRSSPGRGVYESWRTTNNRSVKQGGENGSRFGGWDELVEQAGTSAKFSRKGQNREVGEIQREYVGSGKLSRRRNGEKPLFMRLLIAVFPLFGSWTRFFF